MKRLIDSYLTLWKKDTLRKPLLLRGARQVGKTYAVRNLAQSFDSFVEINFELHTDAALIFEKDLDPKRIIRDLSLLVGHPIVPGNTLLFFDEIQAAPRAFASLRYFYELLPIQHVIAAGSLLDFTIEEIGAPVGRVMSLYMYPASFVEFLSALNHELLMQEILIHKPDAPISEPTHKKLLHLLGEYIAIGGMPEAIACWQQKKDPFQCFAIHQTLIDTYRQDFNKYAKKFQIKYLDILFDYIPLRLGKKFKYSEIEGDYRKRELAPCLNLLTTAGISNKVFASSGNGIPLGAEADPQNFKVIFLDIALSQALLGLDLGKWITRPIEQFINKGELVEAFVGQELLAYSNPLKKPHLYYWQRSERSSQAEVDYLIQQGEYIIPIEVKSGTGTTLKSMQLFLENHVRSPYGIRFSIQNYSIFEKIHSYPLYGIPGALKHEFNQLSF